MKKLYTISLLVLCIVTTGCSDWLNVAPSNQVNEENLFSTGNGYRNALNGVYLDLGTSTLYGQNLSWGFMDLIAQYYSPVELNKERVYYQALNYKFEHTDVKSIISSIWSRSYNNIANCNNLINQVSNASPSLFEQGELEKNMIHGEALALRAFIHFEILRMFAPAMMKDDHKAYMPYVDVYPTFVPAYETNEEILKKVVADLKEAKRMLAQCDITEEHREWMAINPRMLGIDLSAGDIAEEDVFFAFRGYRMNYYAITAILARVYFWNGEYELAYNEAKEVLDATYDDDGQKCFSFMEYLELGNNMKDYIVRSDREGGRWRSDIVIRSLNVKCPPMILELKSAETYRYGGGTYVPYHKGFEQQRNTGAGRGVTAGGHTAGQRYRFRAQDRRAD